MAACGVADRDQGIEPERRGGARCVRHVDERLRVAAAGPDPAVLDVPRRPTPRREVVCHGPHQVEAVPCTPEAAVDQDGGRAGLAPELAELIRMVAVPVRRQRSTSSTRTA
jgi:hypothetical protein